jgi:hypothetical protein
MFDQLSAERVPSLIKKASNTTNNNEAKCIPGPAVLLIDGRVIAAYTRG